MKRILDCGREDFAVMDGRALFEAVRAGEGRTVMCEVFYAAAPLVEGVGNADLVVAFGADLVLLNMFDEGDLEALRRRLGRPVGVNVEPTPDIPGHRRATAENLARLAGADFLVVTANPDASTSPEAMVAAAALAREAAPERLVFAGRMHGSGRSGMPDREEVGALCEVADAVLGPAPGTVPGSKEGAVADLIATVHAAGRLAVAAVGTSQEGADPDTVRALALGAKRAGADILHLGDAGASGMAEPMNILAASIAIRGRRHTYRRMAMREREGVWRTCVLRSPSSRGSWLGWPRTSSRTGGRAARSGDREPDSSSTWPAGPATTPRCTGSTWGRSGRGCLPASRSPAPPPCTRRRWTSGSAWCSGSARAGRRPTSPATWPRLAGRERSRWPSPTTRTARLPAPRTSR